jgi:hypothetical protein
MLNFENLNQPIMKRSFFIFILLIIIYIQGSAQKVKDVLYLKNGSKIYGNLMEITDNQYKIQTSDGSLFIYSIQEVDKYEKETPEFKGRKKDGIGLAMEGGFLVGSQTSSYPVPFSFIVGGSYTVDTKNILSVGSGAEFLGKTYTPVFFEFKRLVYDKKVTPFFFFRSGLLLYLGPNYEDSNIYYPTYYNRKNYGGGGSLTIGTGISWSRDEMETYLSFAYRYAQTNYIESTSTTEDVTYKNNYNRLEIKFGFKF